MCIYSCKKLQPIAVKKKYINPILYIQTPRVKNDEKHKLYFYFASFLHFLFCFSYLHTQQMTTRKFCIYNTERKQEKPELNNRENIIENYNFYYKIIYYNIVQRLKCITIEEHQSSKQFSLVVAIFPHYIHTHSHTKQL